MGLTHPPSWVGMMGAARRRAAIARGSVEKKPCTRRGGEGVALVSAQCAL